MGCCPWGPEEWDTTEATIARTHVGKGWRQPRKGRETQEGDLQIKVNSKGKQETALCFHVPRLAEPPSPKLGHLVGVIRELIRDLFSKFLLLS